MLGCSNRRGVRHEGVHEESEFPRPSFDRISKVTARVLGRACARGRRWKWTSGIRRVIVQTFRGKTALPCLPIAQPDGPVFGERSRSKAKGDRSIERKMTPWPCVPWLEATRTAPRSTSPFFSPLAERNDQFDHRIRAGFQWSSVNHLRIIKRFKVKKKWRQCRKRKLSGII